MSETAHSHAHLESPASGSTLPQGRHLLRGWVWPKGDAVFADVRARLGARIFPGIHGLPRPDLAAHFQIGRPIALAEFSIVVALEPGAATVELEALALDGRWMPFATASYRVEPAAPPADFAVPCGPLRWIDHLHGLRLLLHHATREPRTPLSVLAGRLADELPWPRVTRDAPPPLLGFVDEPASVCCCRFGRIPAFGHLFHQHLRIRRILATVDLHTWQPLEIHRPSPGPAAHYPEFAHAQACGFAGLVDVPAQLPNPASLRIYAELEDGSLQLGPVVRTRLHTQEDEKPAAGAGVDFADALAAWDQALTTRAMDVTRDDELSRRLDALREDHERTGRSRPRLVAPLSESPSSAGSFPPRHVLLATHGLGLQGAPRFLLELARMLAGAKVQLTVVTAEEGPLRGEFEALGARVHVVDCAPLLRAATVEAARHAVAGLVSQAPWAACEVIIANSFTTFWAAHAAKAAQRPVLLYVHESTTPALFYDRRVPTQVVTLAEEAFALADAVSFTSAATRACHLGYGRPERHRLTPGWVEVAALDRWRAGQDRAALRRMLGVQPDEQLVCNIGTVSDRKGQHTFVRAVDLFARHHPDLAARTRFILLGGRDSPFDAMLRDVLLELGRDNIVVHPETADYLRYYLAADIFVCSSYEESSPRVVFEAMALGTPILASAVPGIAELVRNGHEARLLPPGDSVAWGEGLAELLSGPKKARALAAAARIRAERNFDHPLVMPRHLSLITRAACGGW